jgi:hypothetical protein
MSAKAHIAHQTDGRVRLSIPERRGDVHYFAALQDRFSGIGQVHRVSTNPVTGSVLLEFTGNLDQVMRAADGSGMVEFETAAKRELAGRRGEAPAAYTELMLRLRAGNLNPMMLAAGMFAVVGVLQTMRGKVMVPAMTAFWYAANVYWQARTPPDSADAVIEGIPD